MPETELGQYRLLQRLGAGGMGEVFLARLEREEGFSKLLVVKRILPELSESEKFQEMFSNEARIAASLNHPQVVQVTDFGRIGKNCFLAMEYIDGTDLAALLQAARGLNRQMELSFIVAVGLACLRALDYAHRQSPPVIHGDVSPSNVLVGREGEVKLSDFGLARIAGKSTQPDEPSIQGKLAYMAPEVARGRPVSEKSDLFGVGAVLFELITSRPPREEKLEDARHRAVPPVLELYPDAHPALAQIVDRALSASEEDRFQDASEMEDALLRLSSTLGLDPGPRAVGKVVSDALGAGDKRTPAVIPRTLVALPDKPKARWSLIATGVFVLIVGIAVYVLLAATQDDPEQEEPDAGVVALVVEEPREVTPLDSGVTEPDKGPPRRKDRRRKAVARHPPREVLDAGTPEQASDPGPGDAVRVAQAEPEPRGFSLQAKRPVSCQLDDRPWQPMPLDYKQLLREAHVVKLRSKSGFEATIRMEATEKPAGVRLAIRSKPFAVLYIDGSPKGLTPKGRIGLARGSHQITLAPSGREPMELVLLLR